VWPSQSDDQPASSNDDSRAYQRPIVRRASENAQSVVAAAVEPVVGTVLRRFEVDPAHAAGVARRSGGKAPLKPQIAAHLFSVFYHK
jgi:hypothetical protein